MNYSNACCGGCDCGPEEFDKNDKDAILKEQETILEAKLATIRHWRENLKKKTEDKKSS